ncbi:glutaredoxin domain-containing protein [Zhihengliuella flava]|uniref:Glutaredoxin n=1 Tax=Zhihengliuella flava TaxID=1285193 RepID=A0A931DBM9_9MICC|nr:glutaredoxin domain-containing protein [Zhihengliuella flava]MBG6083903.1 glutaredoxin [Zhihengliuella flava]
MRRLFAQPWVLTLLILVLAALVAARALSGPVDGVAVAFALGLAIFSGFTAIAAVVPSRPDAGVEQHVADGGVAVFWRPGCTFCLRLMWKLRSHLKDVYWVNIWKDDDAAARVRELNGGNETVPTVLTSEEHYVATDRARALETVRSHASRG